MKQNTKKYIAIGLLSFGIILLCLSVLLTFIEAESINIIGGVSLPTLIFVFSHENGGMYLLMALLSIIAFIFAFIFRLKNK